MTGASQTRALQDSRINIYDLTERKYWARWFGVSQGQLMKVVEQVGRSIEAVRNALRNALRRKS